MLVLICSTFLPVWVWYFVATNGTLDSLIQISLKIIHANFRLFLVSFFNWYDVWGNTVPYEDGGDCSFHLHWSSCCLRQFGVAVCLDNNILISQFRFWQWVGNFFQDRQGGRFLRTVSYLCLVLVQWFSMHDEQSRTVAQTSFAIWWP